MILMPPAHSGIRVQGKGIFQKGRLKELSHGDFQVFWSKLPQIRTKYLCHTQNTYRTLLRGRYQVNFRRENTLIREF